MKKRIYFYLFISIFLLGSVVVLNIYNYNSAPFKEEQVRIAERLGVEINDHPYPDVFPEWYFQSVLTKTSTVEEVHNLVVGYKKVFTCGKNIETYYYFSDSDKKALRFKISYSNDPSVMPSPSVLECKS